MIDFLRLASIFGGLGNQEPSFRTPEFNPYGSGPTFGGSYNPFGQEQGQEAIRDNFGGIPSLADLFKPNMEMQNRFRMLLDQFPQRENPSGWRKFGAFLTGLGGENAAEAMQLSNTAANLPYLNKLQDWTAQANPMLKAVDDERMYNQQGLTMANQHLARLMDQKRIEETERYHREQTRVADDRLRESNRAALEREERLKTETDIRRRYVEIAEFKKENPDYKWFEVQGGNIVGIHPRTGEVIDSKIPTGTATDVEKSRLQLQNALSLEDARQKGRIEAIQTPRPPTIHITTGGSGGANELEVQRRVENRKRRMMIERKDLYDWIDPATGTYKRNAPPNIQQEITDYIYGEKEPGAAVTGVRFGQGGGNNQPPPQTRPANRPAPPSIQEAPRVRQDGKVFIWDNETGQYGYVFRDAVIKAKTADGKMRFEVIR